MAKAKAKGKTNSVGIPQGIKPKFDWGTPQQEWEFPIRIPLKRETLKGDFINARGRILSSVNTRTIAMNGFVVLIHSIDEPGVKWCPESSEMLCCFLHDNETLWALRKPTANERKWLRTPEFIQDDEYPMCCGSSMMFVKQIEDLDLHAEPPPGAKSWWHDAVEFYIFTCGKCLECKVVGQQF